MIKFVTCTLIFLAVDTLATAQSPDDPLIYDGPARQNDSVWMVDTRTLSESTEDNPGFQVRRSRDSQWQDGPVGELLTAADCVSQTIIYVHGYGFDPEKCDRVGWAMYHAMCDDLPAAMSVQYIVWSWPSTASGGPLRMLSDIKHKAKRTDIESYLLAWLLTRFDAKPKITVIGSAMGCRAVTGALHFCGGGEIRGVKLKTATTPPKLPEIRTVLITPALDNTWLYPGGRNSQAVTSTSRMLLIDNSTDSMLAKYRLLSFEEAPTALGTTGVETPGELGSLAGRIEQIDATEQIGSEHGVENYLRNEMLTDKIRDIAIW